MARDRRISLITSIFWWRLHFSKQFSLTTSWWFYQGCIMERNIFAVCLFVCFLSITKASFVTVTTGNPRTRWRYTALIFLSTSASHLYTQSVHKHTHTHTHTHTHNDSTFILTPECRDNKDSLSFLFLTCKHAESLFCGKMNISSDIIRISPEISFLNATPLTIELLSVPQIGHLSHHSC